MYARRSNVHPKRGAAQKAKRKNAHRRRITNAQSMGRVDKALGEIDGF